MAGASLFVLLDDIATVLDDVALLTKIAAKKTAGVVGDDLALNAKQVQGIAAARELPVVWAVAKGSFVNKLILVPVALLLSVVAPTLTQWLLMIGGAYLCFEGAEKILHARDAHPHLDTPPDALDEKAKIRGAIRTDFILSAEIVVIALGTLAVDVSFGQRVLVLSVVAVAMTIGVYGLVAAIVKLDDLGLLLLSNERAGALHGLGRRIGAGLIGAAPWLMKFLAIAGTIAMFMVGGGILLHGVPALHAPDGALGALAAAVAGLVTGFAVLGVVELVRRVVARPTA